VREVFGFVKRNMSGAQRRKSAASGERGVGKGAAALVPTQRWRDPERDKRSVNAFASSGESVGDWKRFEQPRFAERLVYREIVAGGFAPF
jgi:hypothetical protein